MSLPIQPVRPEIIAEIVAPGAASSPSGEFRNLLSTAMNAVEQTQQQAKAAVNSFLAGDSTELHSVALAGQRADLSMDLFLQVRNKVISAYQEIMKMQM